MPKCFDCNKPIYGGHYKQGIRCICLVCGMKDKYDSYFYTSEPTTKRVKSYLSSQDWDNMHDFEPQEF